MIKKAMLTVTILSTLAFVTQVTPVDAQLTDETEVAISVSEGISNAFTASTVDGLIRVDVRCRALCKAPSDMLLPESSLDAANY